VVERRAIARLAAIGHHPVAAVVAGRRELGAWGHELRSCSERSDRLHLVEHAVVVADERGVRHGAEVPVRWLVGAVGPVR
jgi:hypothetical protein